MSRQKWFDHKFNLGIGVGWTENVLNRLEDTELRLRHHVQQLSEEQLTRKNGSAYSIKEHIGHLVDLEILWSNRFSQFKDKVPELLAADLKNKKTILASHNDQSIEQLLENFRSEREKLIAVFNGLDAEDHAHQTLHPRLKVNMQPVDLLFFVAEHDDHHLTSIKELIRGMNA